MTSSLPLVRHADFATVDQVLRQRAQTLSPVTRELVAEAIAMESARADLDPLFVLAVIAIESDFQQGAVSSAGARGLMQVRPTTLVWVADREGLGSGSEADLDDPVLSVRIGVRYLTSLRRAFRGRLDLALMAYNAGPTKVAALMQEEGGLDSLKGYVTAVRHQYSAFRRLAGVDDGWAVALREPQGGEVHE